MTTVRTIDAKAEAAQVAQLFVLVIIALVLLA